MVNKPGGAHALGADARRPRRSLGDQPGGGGGGGVGGGKARDDSKAWEDTSAFTALKEAVVRCVAVLRGVVVQDGRCACAATAEMEGARPCGTTFWC